MFVEMAEDPEGVGKRYLEGAESLRAALNLAYRVKERRSYLWCVMESSMFVVLSAIGMLALTWGVVVGPEVAARLKPSWLLWLTDTGSAALVARYAIVVVAIGLQLIAYHLWLAAGRRRLADVWPGVLLSIVLWLIAARLFASWLTISDYSRFYAGLTQVMSALVFFQVSSLIVILGAELNRGIVEMRRKLAAWEALDADASTMPAPPSRSSYRVDL